MSVEYVKPSGAMHGGGGGGSERYRLVVVVGVLLVLMTAVIVGVTVWVVTQQTAGDELARAPTETVVNYVGWEEAPPPPESDSRLTDSRPANTGAEPSSLETARSVQIQASMAQLSPSQPRPAEPDLPPPADYSQNVADVMKRLQAQPPQQPQHDVRQAGTIQAYGTLETYRHDRPPAWPGVPNRMGAPFEGVAHPYSPTRFGPMSAPSGDDGAAAWQPKKRPHEPLLGPSAPGQAAPPGMSLRPFQPEPERPPYRRRGDGEGGRPRRPPLRRPPPPYRSRSEANRTRDDDKATNAGLDLAVSGWSAFSFGVFLIRKLVQIMGYSSEARMVPDETGLFLRVLDIAGRVAGFDASEELSVLGRDLFEERSGDSESAQHDADDQPAVSKVDLVNGLFRIGLNMVNLYTGESELNIAECLWGAYCEDLQQRSRAANVDGVVARVNSIGLKLIRGDVEDYIGVGQMMDMIRRFDGSDCGMLFPMCHGTQAVGFMADLLGGA